MRNGTGWVGAASTSAPSVGQWYCVELHWKSDAAAGFGELYLDGVLTCLVSGVDTATLGGVNMIRFGLAEINNCDATTVYAESCIVSKTYLGF